MAQNYKLKKGVLLQAFGDASKTVTNDSPHFTDELAEWYLKNYPEKAIYFAVIPGRSSVPDEIRNRPPGRTRPIIIVPPEKDIPKITDDFIKAAMVDPSVTVIAPEVIPEVIPQKKVIPKVIPKKKVVATKRRK